jgi:hypothetical protein
VEEKHRKHLKKGGNRGEKKERTSKKRRQKKEEEKQGKETQRGVKRNQIEQMEEAITQEKQEEKIRAGSENQEEDESSYRSQDSRQSAQFLTALVRCAGSFAGHTCTWADICCFHCYFDWRLSLDWAGSTTVEWSRSASPPRWQRVEELWSGAIYTITFLYKNK